MFKSPILFAIALLLACSLPAQKEQPVILVSSKGKVCYQSPAGGKYQKVAAGAMLRNTGALKLSGKASATVYANGKFEMLGKGNHALASIYGVDDNMRKNNFDTEFGDFLTAAVLLAAAAQGHSPAWLAITDPKTTGDGWGITDPKKSTDGWGIVDPKKSSDGWGIVDPKKSSDGWGIVDPKKSSDGWGGKGNKITLILPFGKLLPESVRFSWSKPANAATYKLDIMDPSKQKIHTATVRDTFFDLDLRSLSLTPGIHYFWQVTVPGNTDLVSNTLEFSLDTKENRTEALHELSTSKLYPIADPATHAMMEALALEVYEWYSPAANTYAALLEQYPKNNMVRMMYAAFWMRYGLRQMADKAVVR